MLKIHDHAKKFWTEIEFEVKDKAGNIGNWTMRWNAKSLESDGNVYVILINNHYLFTKQHRPTLGKWKKEKTLRVMPV